MIKTKDEIIASITSKIGEDTSDEALALLEDVTDTLNDYEVKVNDTTNWKSKYEENDNMWRERYKERFMNNAENLETGAGVFEEDKEQTAPKTFEDLFEITK